MDRKQEIEKTENFGSCIEKILEQSPIQKNRRQCWRI